MPLDISKELKQNRNSCLSNQDCVRADNSENSWVTEVAQTEVAEIAQSFKQSREAAKESRPMVSHSKIAVLSLLVKL